MYHRAIQTNPDPHRGQRIFRYGPPPSQARIGAILVHGRGASADDILGLAPALRTTDVSYVAPQAAGNTWYPNSFLAPIEQNEPGITSGLALIGRLIAAFGEQGLPPERVVLLGFSQGACLSLEFAARHVRRYHAVIGFSGGVIGPPGTPRNYPGSVESTPVFLGCSDVDPHIPLARVHETGDVFRALNARVDERIYRGMGHTINEDEIKAARALLAAASE